MRPKQKEYRKRAREAEAEAEGAEGEDRLPGGQALPIAELPDDFTGEAEDGATYLALALRDNANLPNFKTVPNPYRQPTPPPLIGPVITMDNQSQPVAGSSRHPALPRDSWRVLFPVHFQNYRKSIAKRWPPASPLPYPSTWPTIPLTRQRDECRYFIQGHPRARVRLPARPGEEDSEEEEMNADPALALAGEEIGNDMGDKEEDDEEAAMNMDYEDGEMDMEDEEAALNRDDTEIALDVDHQEAALNGDSGEAALGVQNTGAVEVPVANGENGNSEKNEVIPQHKKAKVEYGFESESEKHKSRDPLVSVLQTYNASEIIQLLGHITKHIEELLSEAELSLSLPQSPSTPSTTSSEPAIAPLPNPFPTLYSKWIFSSLLVLDQHLDSTHIYKLRELARVIMRVGAWRWVYAVTHGEVSDGDGWVLGGRRKAGEGKEVVEKDVDEVLARCWVCVYAIGEGWGQRDLLEDLERLFT